MMITPQYGLFMRRLLGYLLIIAATGLAFWLVGLLRDVY